MALKLQLQYQVSLAQTRGTEEKPVGTVFLAFGSAGDMRVRRLFMPVARGMFQRMIAAMALDLVRRFVKGLDTNVELLSRIAA